MFLIPKILKTNFNNYIGHIFSPPGTGPTAGLSEHFL